MTTVPPLPEPGDQTVEDRKAISRRFVQHAWQELAKGNRFQAGEKAWGAVAQYLKIVGQDREWNHRSHRNLENIGRQICAEFPDHAGAEFANALSDAYHRGHENFYDNLRTALEIRETIEGVEQALPVLEAIVNEPPQRFKISSNSQRRRLIELTDNHELKVGDESPVGFSNRHERFYSA